jgi:mannobiose 2-epimerase
MATAAEFRQALQQHVIRTWFPRSIDREAGGFLCDFELFPEDSSLREAAHHGFAFLKNVLWDAEFGGWFHAVDRTGRPLEQHTKHIHGFAYALSACAAVFELTGDPEVKRHADAALAWMDRYAYDDVHGGYFGYLQRDGSRIHNASPAARFELDTVGTEVGFKDLNVQSDLLETFALMHRTWPAPHVTARLTEYVDIIARKMVNTTTGALHFFVTDDWQPVPHLIRTGYQMHSAYRLLLALGRTGQDELIRQMCLKQVDCAIRYAHDGDGRGYYYAATGALPIELHGESLRIRRRTWWVQMEALKALLAASTVSTEPARYRKLFDEQWQYIGRHFFDSRHGGVYVHGTDNLRFWQRRFDARLAPTDMTRKGDIWKDASHEGRAMIFCMQTLGGATA